MTEIWDAIIIGGGPAGAATAINARRHGCRVLVLEAERFPRHHVGESLVEQWAIFEDLGVAEELDATFQRKHGSTRIWGRDARIHSANFAYVPGRRKYSLQVERSLFDQILLRRAETVGATVLQGHRVTEVLWEDERAVGVRYQQPNGAGKEARAGFVIDASGRAGLIAHMLQLRQIDPFYPDLSVYGYFRDFEPFGKEGGDLVIEAVPWGWLWFIPLHTGEVSVGLVCDRSSRRRLQELGREAFLREAINQSTIQRRLLAEATLVGPPIVTASYGYSSKRRAGPGWILAGDAGFFSDPMWSSGVFNALQDGILASATVEAVTSGRVEEMDAIRYYDREVNARSESIDTIVKFVYRCNHLHRGDGSGFWDRRHQYLDGEPLPVDRIRRMTRNAFAGYFRQAIAGMGADASLLAVIDGEADRLQRQRETVGHVAQNPDAWAPFIPESVALRRVLREEAGRLVEGLELSHDDATLFAGNAYAISALQAVDGQRSFRRIINEVLETAPPGERFPLHFHLMQGFIKAYSHGALDARTATGESLSTEVLAP